MAWRRPASAAQSLRLLVAASSSSTTWLAMGLAPPKMKRSREPNQHTQVEKKKAKIGPESVGARAFPPHEIALPIDGSKPPCFLFFIFYFIFIVIVIFIHFHLSCPSAVSQCTPPSFLHACLWYFCLVQGNLNLPSALQYLQAAKRGLCRFAQPHAPLFYGLAPMGNKN